MNVLNNSSDDVVECPLCMEPLEVDDLNFFPCTCGYQICRFCWHRIRTDENELCPACRKAYPENPADFTPLSQEQIAALKAEKRQRDQQRKQKITENRKHLANVRVVQKNLVFVVGLPPRLADADILKKHEYFGKYGKIHKVVINPSTTYAGVQGPSASAYVTYVHNNDALKAIQSVNNIMIDGRLIKTSLGTTKYCSHFMKNQQCPKSDCMYLHELGDQEASFTKEEMHQGKHQEYEKRLHDALIASTNGSVTTNCKNGDNKLANGTGPVQTKEAWPSLSVSPINKETTKSGKGSNKENGTKSERKHDKAKGDKKGQKNQKLQNGSNQNNHNNNKENSNVTSNSLGNNHIANQNGTKDTTTNGITISTDHHKHPKSHQQMNHHVGADDEINMIDDLEKDALSDEMDGKNADTQSLSSSSSSNNGDSASLSESTSGKSSPGSFPDHPLSTTVLETNGGRQLQSTADKLENHSFENNSITSANKLTQLGTTDINCVTENNKRDINNRTTPTTNGVSNVIDTTACLSKLSLFDDNNSFFSTSSFQPLLKGKLENDSRTAMNNHFNNAISSHLPDLLNGTNHDNDRNHKDTKLNILKGIDQGYQNQNSVITNGGLVDNPEKYLLSLNTNEDWEAAFKYVMLRNNKQLEDQEEFIRMQEIQKRNNLINSMGMSQMNGGGTANGVHDFNADFFNGGTDINRLSQAAMFQQQRQPNNMHHNDHMMSGNMFGTNMSKFFDFHKNQQQQQQQHHHPPQYMMNGHSNGMINDHRDQLSMATLLENNRINSQYLEHTNGLIGQQLQKQRLLNKFDQMGTHNHNNMVINSNNNNSNQQQQQQNRIHNQFAPNAPVDDDLGFDPFIETQKALAELMENEMVQQQTQNNHNKHLLDNCQRTRMPPPGFNHMNAFGFGVPRAQGSKILPFMNMGNNASQQQQQQAPQQNNWAQHMGFQQPPHSQQPDHQQHMTQPNQNGSTQHSKTGYGNIADWTAMDPAILSFRQFPSYSSGPSHQQPPPPPQQQHQQQQHTTPDMFMQHLSQQNVPQPSGTGFGHHGINLPNNILNQQPNSPAQVNYSHTNWLNTEQSMFMNSLANGYSSNYEKFSIPTPSGFHKNNLNCISGNKQQKTECIN